jgi:hypothetical protein
MADLDRVLGWFEAGTLLRPDPLRPSTISLAHALASVGGADIPLDAPAQRVRDAIGEAQHVILFLADGLGMSLIDELSDEAFLCRNLAFEMRSVFPSSTAPALTSLASGLWPAEHGLLGWFVYLPEQGVQAVALPFRERFTSMSLEELGITGPDLFPWLSLMPRFKREARLLMPRNIADSLYTRSISGETPADTYGALNAGVEALIARLTATEGPTYTYFYYPQIDTTAHSRGPTSAAVHAQVQALDVALQRLKDGLGDTARIVVSADHGGIDVDAERKLLLYPDEPIAGMLRTPPSGEPRAPIFHVHAGAEAEFAANFQQRFGRQFALLSTEQVVELGLLGPVELSAVARARLGNFIALSSGREVLVYATDQGMLEMKGFHGGLDPDEVRIPLIVA